MEGHSEQESNREPIAIIGMGCRFPGAADPEALWQQLLLGREAIREIPTDRFRVDDFYDARPATPGRMITRWGGFIDGIDLFDAGFFGMSPREAERLDPQQRLLLETAWEALEAAGQDPTRLRGSETAVFVGIWLHDYETRLFRDPGRIDFYMTTGTGRYTASGRLSHMFDWHGPSITVDCACSSSLVAVHLACRSLWSGECDLALAGGSNVLLEPSITLAYSQSQMMAPDGRCKFGDARANGYVRSDGAGIVVLKPLSRALADGDLIEALIVGSVVNNDGDTSGSFGTPARAGQEDLLRKAYRSARVSPGDVDYVEAHGTGTKVGDPVEIHALAAVLGDGRPANRPLLIGSVKTNIGHTEGAAGIAGLIKVALALKHRTIPRSLHFETPNPDFPWDRFPVEVPCQTRAWPENGRPGIAGVSAFGIAGTNAHVVLKEAPAQRSGAPVTEGAAGAAPGSAFLLPISARSDGALRELANAYRDRLGSGDYDSAEAMRDLCYSAAVRRGHHDFRLAVPGRDAAECASRLGAFLADEATPQLAHGRVERERHRGPVFVFSGQGPQWPGMGRELLATEPVFRGVVERCDALVRAASGWSLLRELQAPEAASRLAETEVTQPALFAVQVALTAVWRAWGIEPSAVVGHSLGEVAAAHIAGALSLEDAVRVVVHRGRIMQQATGRGRMAAVELSAEDAQRAIAGFEDRLAVAAVNALTSTVLSGESAALETVLARLTARGVRWQSLPVNYAFHSPQMEPLAAELVRALAGLSPKACALPLVSTVSGCSVDGTHVDAGYWGRNIRQTVRFADAIAELLTQGFDGFVELSPHPVLSSSIATGLAARGSQGPVAASLRRSQPERLTMVTGLGILYAHGYPVNWDTLCPGGRQYVRMPSYPWQRRRYWIDVGRSRPEASSPESLEELMYEVTWRPKPLATSEQPERASCSELDVAAIVSRAAAARPRELDEEALELERELLPELDLLSVEYVTAGFRRLGVDFNPGAVLGLDAFRQRQVVPRHESVLRRMLEILEEAGVLRARKDGWMIGCRPQVVDHQERWRRLCARFPQCEAELALLNRCGSDLAEVLRGDRDPLECIFPDVSLDEAEKFYGNSPFSRRGNACVREVALATAASLGPGRRLAVLEIGAGTGGTSVHVVPVLAPYLARYVYTDVSNRFLNHGKTRLQQFPQVEYRLLDIERDPRAQGYEDHGYDLIVAANVLHATADLSGTLKHVRSLLAPRGVLVLLEGTRTERWIDLIFGLTPGWWKFEDRLRRPKHPLLSAEAWFRVLTEEGFVGSRAVAQGDGPVRGLFQLQVLVAQAPPPTPSHPHGVAASSGTGQWIVFPAKDPVARAVAALLETRGQKADLMELDPGRTEPEPAAQRIHPDRPDGWDALFRALRKFGEIGPHGIVFLASSNTDGPTATAQECRTALHLVQAIIRAELPHPPRIWLVTRGTASPDPGSDEASLGHATLWGFGRVLAREHPELWGGLVDLDVSATPPDAAAQVAAELPSRDGEDQVAYRAGERRVARVIRASVRATEGRTGIVRGDATYLITGGLGGLGLTVARWMVRRGAKSLVLVGRSGAAQTQRDALDALERDGVRIRVARADVSRREDLATVVRDIHDSLPPLRGVIHAAGTLDDGVLLSQDWGRFERVFAAKVVGTWNLHGATLQTPLDFFVVFSSVASLLGPPGQANHAAANAFQDAFATWRRARGLPALCLNWGPWGSVGAAAATGSAGRQFWEAQGIGFLHPDEGLEILDRALGQGVGQVAGVRAVWPRFLAQLPAGRCSLFSELDVTSSSAAPSFSRQTPGGAARLRWGSLPDSDRSEHVVTQVQTCVASVLGHPTADGVELLKPLTDLGIDSLMAVELKKRLEREWSLEGKLPTTLIFKYPTVHHVAGFIAELLHPASQAAGDPPVAASGCDEDLDAGEAQLAGASEAEIRGLLAEELRSLSAESPDGRAA